jgi:hypothetical protein
VTDTRQQPGAAGSTPASSGSVSLSVDILQGLLMACVVGWVLDLPRRAFGLAFYTEQFLAICLGLGLALTFLSGKPRRPAPLDWSGAITVAIIAGYIVWQYPTPAAASWLVLGAFVLALVWTALGSRAWAMPWFDRIGAVLSLLICAYIAWRY